MPELPLSMLSVYSARPSIRVDSRSDPRLDGLLIALRMTESDGGLAALEVRYSNLASDPQGGAGPAFEDEAILRLGATIAVAAGDENNQQDLFDGLITGLEVDFPKHGPPELVVLAEDAFQRARMARRTRVYPDATLAGLAGEIAGRLSLTPVVSGLTGKIGTQVQLNESDLAFLRRLLNRYDADLQVVGREMHVAPRADIRRGEIELLLHGQLRRLRGLADLAHQVTEVTVGGWDPARGQRVTGRSAGANLGPGSGRTGSQLLRQASVDRSHHLSHLAVTTSDEAQALADAAFDDRARRLVRVEGTAEGNPALRVGTHVRVTGTRSRFDNTYYVLRAMHRYDPLHGYETDFEAESAYLGVA